MQKTRLTKVEIMGVLHQMGGGVPAAELCREHGMSSATLYKWRAKYDGMDANLISEMKAMAEENRRLKRMFADVSMQNDLLLGLTKAKKTWGFGLYFVYLRNVQGWAVVAPLV